MAKVRWKKVGSVTIALVAGLMVAASLYASGGGGQGEGGGSDKLMDLLYRTLNFAGLFAILFFALKKPLVNGLSRRRESIKEQFEDLDARKREAEDHYKEYEMKLSSIDGEVKKILEAAVAQGEVEREKIVEDAKRSAVDIKRQAEMAIQHEMAEARKALRDEIAEQATSMAEELIRKNLRPSDHVKLVDDYLTKVGGLK